MSVPSLLFVAREGRKHLSLCFLLLLLSSSAAEGARRRSGLFPSYGDEDGEDGGGRGRCDRMEDKVSRLEAAVEALDLRRSAPGLWVSEECEVRPGPQFLLRRYEFTQDESGGGADLRFDLLQSHFADRSCRRPIFSASASGRMRPAAHGRTSLLVPGATEAAAAVEHVSVAPHTEYAALEMQRRATFSCPWHSRQRWTAGKEYVVFNSTSSSSSDEDPLDADGAVGIVGDGSPGNGGVDCLDGMRFSFGELRLARVERRPIGRQVWEDQDGGEENESLPLHPRRGHHRVELLLGDIHTDGGGKRSRRYRPTALQPFPLLRANQILGCKTCQKVRHSSALSPPRLGRRAALPAAPEGEWISRRCETRPNFFFLRRRLAFHRNRNWSGNYSYFSDERCSKGIFVAYAQGRYMPSGPSRMVDGGHDYDFKITRVHITPLTSHLASNLRATPAGTCGRDPKAWRPGVAQDITPTGGCAALGLKLPLLERELLKTEEAPAPPNAGGGRGKMLLYLGQIDTDANRPDRSSTLGNRRPTSYQPPLLQCAQESPWKHDRTPHELLPQIRAAALTTRSAATKTTTTSTAAVLLLSAVAAASISH